MKISNAILGWAFGTICSLATNASAGDIHLLTITSNVKGFSGAAAVKIEVDDKENLVSITFNGDRKTMAQLLSKTSTLTGSILGIDIKVPDNSKVLGVHAETIIPNAKYLMNIHYSADGNYKYPYSAMLTKGPNGKWSLAEVELVAGKWVLVEKKANPEVSCLFIGKKGFRMVIHTCEKDPNSKAFRLPSMNQEIANADRDARVLQNKYKNSIPIEETTSLPPPHEKPRALPNSNTKTSGQT